MGRQRSKSASLRSSRWRQVTRPHPLLGSSSSSRLEGSRVKLRVPGGHGGLVWGGGRGVRPQLGAAAGRRGRVFGPVESTQAVMQLVQLGRQRDPQLLVEGERSKPVLQLLEGRPEGGECQAVRTGLTGTKTKWVGVLKDPVCNTRPD